MAASSMDITRSQRKRETLEYLLKGSGERNVDSGFRIAEEDGPGSTRQLYGVESQGLHLTEKMLPPL